ncbi:Bug family tripartite tricarboxylate transporter substrate binding protein [Paucibacter sp. KCTC 42545]|uniref:Bug family tripartite tricarboxylate transporter substrate binding protein n=1 Tax=Paucibacter sp. KCTC 42545 TaxID=1768242 RepID=UPI000733B83B|nr:tripartite tricarboxylate transporter substrate binding protein [Paucibacter sp. KCTC 42545]ALT76147.1 ABC transporter substrate-binding protein [Paucibacter sp. KCTC 42545]
MLRRELLLAGLGAVASPSMAAAAAASAAWPSRPIKLIVPFPGGSSPDIVARALADPLSKALNQTVIIDNRPGAGGNIGTAAAAFAPPDGSTFLFTIQGPLVTAPLLNLRLPYEQQRDLLPVSLVASSPNVLVVDPKLGASDLAAFVRVAKQAKGGLNYGSVGLGSAAHLAMESFKSRAGIALSHVPYAGFAQVVQAILNGEVQAAFMVPGLAMPQVRAGRLKALGVSSLGRVAALAELPTLAEQGFAGFEAISWQAVLAPAKTPAAIVEKLAAALQTIIRSDEFRNRLLTHYFSAIGSSPEGLAQQMRSDRQHWGQIIKAIGLKPE